MKNRKLKYLDKSDEEVDEEILKRLKEIRKSLEEVRDLLKKIGGVE